MEPTARLGLILSSVQGCFLGGLLGDVFGRPFEGAGGFGSTEVQNYFDKALKGDDDRATRRYSDDTAMTIDLVESLIHDPKFSPTHMAQKFTDSYLGSFIDRYYGKGVTTLFTTWKSQKFQNIWAPAQQQFGGMGSFGNGAAMRISPIGFLHNNGRGSVERNQRIVELAIKTSELTHTHPLGMGGAIFQAIVVQNAMQARIRIVEDTKSVTRNSVQATQLDIVDRVEQDLNDIKENYDGGMMSGHEFYECVPNQCRPMDQILDPYLKKLQLIRTFLQQEPEGHVGVQKVVQHLGNGVAAIDSVPTALYSFLVAFNQIPEIETDNQFQRTIQFAITLRGDTDTIASMAGSIAGTYLGVENIPEHLRRKSEGVPEILSLAQKYFNVVYLSDSPESKI